MVRYYELILTSLLQLTKVDAFVARPGLGGEGPQLLPSKVATHAFLLLHLKTWLHASPALIPIVVAACSYGCTCRHKSVPSLHCIGAVKCRLHGAKSFLFFICSLQGPKCVLLEGTLQALGKVYTSAYGAYLDCLWAAVR